MATRETSIAAYNEIKENGLLSKRRWEVYEHVYKNGPCSTKDATDELTRNSPLRSDSFRPRFAELEKMGVLKIVGETTCPLTSHKVILWDVTSGLPKKLEKKEPKITPARVCKVLEGMCLLDLPDNPDNNFASKVYKWCHIVGGTCENQHEDWQADFLESEKAILEAMKAPSEKRKDVH